MPSQVLHTLFGEDLFAKIRRRMISGSDFAAGKVIEKMQDTDAYRGIFALGCQGPDIFYHSRGRRPVGFEYGSLLHRRGAGAFMAELLELGIKTRHLKDGIDALGAYALGFMTHAVLDRLAHPYIVYKSTLLSASKPQALRVDHAHAFFERIIDVLMLKLQRGLEISAWDQDGLLSMTCENPPPGLKELLAQALVRAFPERAGKDEKLKARIENTFHDCAFFYRLTAPSQTLRAKSHDSRQFPLKKRHLVYLYPEELPGHIDFLNLEKRRWFYPAGDAQEDTRSFPELYADALDAAADSLGGIIGKCLSEVPQPAGEVALAIGNGGLSIVDNNGKPCAPCRAEPLPLDEVLEQQAVLRGLSNC